MKTRILIVVAIIAAVLMFALSMTKPDRAAHFDAIKQMALKTVDHELTSNPLTAEYATIGTMTALNMIDEYLQTNLIVQEHTFYTSGLLIYKDLFIPVSYGVMGEVHLVVSEADMKRIMERPEMKQMKDELEKKQKIELKKLLKNL